MRRFIYTLLCLSLFLCMLVACGDGGDSTESGLDKSQASSLLKDEDGSADGSNEGQNSNTGNSSNNGGSTTDSASSSNGNGEIPDIGEDDTTDSASSSNGNGEIPDIGGDYTPDKDNVKYQYDMKEFVTLPAYKGYEVTVSLDIIQRQIDSYIMNYAEKSKKTVCMMGDVVNITYFGYKLDENGDILYENGKEVLFDESDSCGVYLGAKLFLEQFEKGIVGMKIGDIKEVYVTFPNDYFEEDVAGETVMFEIILNSIYEPPMYNDEFVKEYLPSYGGVKDFEESLEENLVLEEIYDYIFENAKILSYPEKEYKDMSNELEELAKDFSESYGVELDEYIYKNYGMTREEYIKNELKTQMIFYAIAQAEGVLPSEDELLTERNNLIEHYIKYYNEQGVDYREAVLKAQELVDDLGIGYIYENVIYEKIDKKITELASVTREPMTYKSITQYICERENAQTGSNVGDLCPSFEAEIFDENGSLGTSVDPTMNFGKLTVINFWGTWCGPCKSELPDFDRVASEFGDQVTIFAVHSTYNFKDASEYVLDNFADSSIIFLKDLAKGNGDDEFYALLGGANYYPYTVILDENGVIRGTHIGMLSYDQLVNILSNIGLER